MSYVTLEQSAERRGSRMKMEPSGKLKSVISQLQTLASHKEEVKHSHVAREPATLGQVYTALCEMHMGHGRSELPKGPFVPLHCNKYSEKLASRGEKEKGINAEKHPKFSSLPSCSCQNHCERFFKESNQIENVRRRTSKPLLWASASSLNHANRWEGYP